jgi:cytochrome c553
LNAVYVGRQLENFANGVRGKHADDLEGIRMMPMARTLIAYKEGLRDEAGTQVNIKALGAYVAQLPAVSPEDYLAIGDASEGKGIFDSKCKACHGDAGEGKDKIDATQGVKLDGEPIFAGSAPSLADQADWYLLKQLEKFQAGVRGHDPVADPAGATMVKWATQLDEEQTRDVVRYIASLK